MQNKILLATRNQGKIKELGRLMQTWGLEVLGLDAFPDLEEVEETGSSFEENALLKARYAAGRSGLVCLADDSGLEVPALGNAPGVHSARFYLEAPQDFLAAQPLQDKDSLNIAWLLEKMRDIPAKQRQGRFCSVIAAVLPGPVDLPGQPGGQAITAAGFWEGEILFARRGQGGFGYDPVFFDPDLKCSAAELTLEEKNARSHRARALERLAGLWPEFWNNFVGGREKGQA